ncbi:MAG TPA: M56 family metallopeptidase [Terriglobales bacterium]|nr:M56 family metallopeptidase [Terriglobales bacterium]
MAVFHALMTFLLNAAWQICLVAMITSACLLLARRARVWMRHVIWVLALLASTLLPLLSLLLVDGHGLPLQSVRLSQIDEFRQKIDSSLWLDGEGVAGSSTIPSFSGVRLLLSTLLVFYLLFLAYRLGRLALRWRNTWQMLEATDAKPISYCGASITRAASVAEECQRILGARSGSISILCSAASIVPFTAGVFRPIVVLPQALLQTASDDELRVAISHELVHILRHDYLLNILYEIVSLPVAFHPLVLWMKRHIERTREAACDEIAACCLESPTGYARALVSLARALPQPPSAPVANSPALGVFDGSNLEERIMQLIDKTPRLTARAAAGVLTVSIVILLATCAVGYNFALAAGREDAASSATGQPNVSGIWAGQLSEKLPDGRVGHGTLYLHLEQNGDKVTGVGGDTEAHATPMQNIILNGNHMKFTATATGGPKGSVNWTVDLDIKGDVMEGRGHAFRSADNHSWDVDIRLARSK